MRYTMVVQDDRAFVLDENGIIAEVAETQETAAAGGGIKWRYDVDNIWWGHFDACGNQEKYDWWDASQRLTFNTRDKAILHLIVGGILQPHEA